VALANICSSNDHYGNDDPHCHYSRNDHSIWSLKSLLSLVNVNVSVQSLVAYISDVGSSLSLETCVIPLFAYFTLSYITRRFC